MLKFGNPTIALPLAIKKCTVQTGCTVLEAVEVALEFVITSLQPDQEMDGALLSIENILQRMINLKSIFEGSHHYSAVVRNIGEMVERLRVIEGENERMMKGKGRPTIVMSVSTD